MNLEEMRAIEQAASEGPWEINGAGEYVSGVGLMVAPDDGGVSGANAEFIAASRTFVPDALDALEEILELHSHEVYDSNRRMCSACGGTVPCMTRRIIEKE